MWAWPMIIAGLKFMNVTNPVVGGCAHVVGASHMIYTLFNGLFTHNYYVKHDLKSEND